VIRFMTRLRRYIAAGPGGWKGRGAGQPSRALTPDYTLRQLTWVRSEAVTGPLARRRWDFRSVPIVLQKSAGWISGAMFDLRQAAS